MSKSSVNVLIFTYNQENLVKETLESVINQSYQNISKIIVADDGSTDETPHIIEEHALRNPLIEPVLAKKNKGIAYNMNRALKRVDADYVSFLDGDDLMFPQKIEKQVNYLDANPDLVACSHDMDVFDSSKGRSLGKFSEVISFKKIKGKIGVESIFDPSILLCPSSNMYRAEILPSDGFDTRVKYFYEFLFMVEVLIKGKLGFMDEVLGLYRLHSANVTSSPDFKELGLENTLIVYSIITSRYPELYSQVKKRKTATYLARILEYIRDGNNKRAKDLSKVLMSEGSIFKGFVAYMASFILSEERAEKLFKNKRLIKIFLKYG
jgi:glycosyltransferase involved in cell wall biosynthesis